MDRGEHPLTMVVAVLLALAAGGCQPKPTDGPATMPSATDGGPLTWPYWPVSMTVHPLTRIAIDRTNETPVLEARLEFADQHGATTKAFGQVLLELSDDEPDGGGTLSEVWTIDLRDPQLNAIHFDEITRTYLFKLQLNEPHRWRRPQLRAEYHGADERVLSDWRNVRPYIVTPPNAEPAGADRP